jgi:hypothetical protein
VKTVAFASGQDQFDSLGGSGRMLSGRGRQVKVNHLKKSEREREREREKGS